MKKLLIAALATLSFSAFADQCAYISGTMASRGALLLSGAEIAEVCEPCGERAAIVSTAKVGSLMVRDTGYMNYKEIVINGKGVDLAYTFVKIASKRFVNVAKVIGCKADGVSSFINK